MEYPRLETNWTGETEFVIGPLAGSLNTSTVLFGPDTTRLALWVVLTTVFDLITPISLDIRGLSNVTAIPLATLTQQNPTILMRVCDWGPILQGPLTIFGRGASSTIGSGYWRPTGSGGK